MDVVEASDLSKNIVVQQAIAQAQEILHKQQQEAVVDPSVAHRHSLVKGSVDGEKLTGICRVCGEVKVQRTGSYTPKDGPIRHTYRCENYMREYRARAARVEAGEDPLPTPRRGRPSRFIPDVKPAPGMSYKKHVELSEAAAEEQSRRCRLCERATPGYLRLQLALTPAGQRLHGAYCEDCRELFTVSLGSPELLVAALRELTNPDMRDYSAEDPTFVEVQASPSII